MAKSIIDKVEAEIEIAEAKVESRNKLMGQIKYIIVAVVLLAEAIMLGAQIYNRYVPNAQYKEAVVLYEQGKKKEALSKFKELGELKNSEYYCNLIYSENPLYRFDNCEVGDEITFGKYNFEDIEWTVIEVNENNVVLISKYIIDAGSFPSENWITTFSRKAFSSSEKTYVEKVYLLDRKSYSNLVQGKSYAKTEPTSQVLKNEKYLKDEKNGYRWWIDEESLYDDDKHRYIDQAGSYTSGIEDDNEILGIRPAISIDLK